MQSVRVFRGVHALLQHPSPAAQQVPLQLVTPELQVRPQVVPLQVAVPLADCGQAVHDVDPQFATLVLRTHAVPHRCEPFAHGNVHLPLVHNGVVFAGTGEQSALVQQAALAMQAEPHSLNPVAHG